MNYLRFYNRRTLFSQRALDTPKAPPSETVTHSPHGLGDRVPKELPVSHVAQFRDLENNLKNGVLESHVKLQVKGVCSPNLFYEADREARAAALRASSQALEVKKLGD